MDDLDVAFHLEPFVSSGDENHHPVLDEQIAVAALDGVAVSHAQCLRPSCGLTSGHVH